MLTTIAIVLPIFRALGLLAFPITAGVRHVLVALAVLAVAVHLRKGNRLLA